MRRRLVILAESVSKNPNTEPMPAIDRYTGIFFRVLKNAMTDARLTTRDVVVVSTKYGVVRGDEGVPYYEAQDLHLRKLGRLRRMTEKEMATTRASNLGRIRKIIAKGKYSEIILNVGIDYMKLLEGLEKVTSAKITRIEGLGLGPKARNFSLALTRQNAIAS